MLDRDRLENQRQQETWREMERHRQDEAQRRATQERDRVRRHTESDAGRDGFPRDYQHDSLRSGRALWGWREAWLSRL